MIVCDEGPARGSPARGCHQQLARGVCQCRRNVFSGWGGRKIYAKCVCDSVCVLLLQDLVFDLEFVPPYFGAPSALKMFELIHHTTVLFSSHWPLTDINDNPKTGGKAAGAWQYGSLYLCLVFVWSILHSKTLRTRIAALQATTSVGSSLVGTRRVTGEAQELTGIWPLT